MQVREGLGRVRFDLVIALQTGVAAGLAWLVAHYLIGHVRPFFAPVAAVIVLGGAMGQRWRRALEMLIGVALGIAIGDALVAAIGVGVLQISAVVILAILVVAFAGGGGVAMGQAATSAVLVTTLAPPTGGIMYVDRFLDSLVGGTVGLLVLALLLPFNPLTRVRRDAGTALAEFAESLRMTATALREADLDLAGAALTRLRAFEEDRGALRDSIALGRETATIAPIRWRARPELARYVDAVVHVERAARNVRVGQRRVQALLRDGEPRPQSLAHALDRLADAVLALRAELARGVEPLGARAAALDAVRAAAHAYDQGLGFSGSTVVAQVRSAALDLQVAAGLDEIAARAAVLDAAAPQGDAAG